MAKKKSATDSELDAFLEAKAHPLHDEIQVVRKAILGADASVREEIKWNSVSFRNERDFFATVNLRSTESVQLVFHTGAKKKATANSGVKVSDPTGLVAKWPAKDRCLVDLGPDGAKPKAKALAEFVQGWLPLVE